MVNASDISRSSASNALALWLALELRRARDTFDQGRQQQDAFFEAKGLRKSGPRVKAALKSASAICVSLADATIAKSREFHSTRQEVIEAQRKVEAFTKEVTSSAIPLAYFVSGETEQGGNVVKAAIERGNQLCKDIEGAFTLAAMPPSNSMAESPPLERLFALWRQDAARDFESDRDAVTGEFSKSGRLQSGYHIRRLVEAAEIRSAEFLERARLLPIPPDEIGAALGNAMALLNDLGNDIRAVAIGVSGRMPRPENAKVVEQFLAEARNRIDAQAAKWWLEDGLKQSVYALQAVEPEKRRRGRKPGSGSMAKADAPLLAEMRQLLDAAKAHSPEHAAKLVWARAAGNGTEASKITRLAKRFRNSEQNSDA